MYNEDKLWASRLPGFEGQGSRVGLFGPHPTITAAEVDFFLRSPKAGTFVLAITQDQEFIRAALELVGSSPTRSSSKQSALKLIHLEPVPLHVDDLDTVDELDTMDRLLGAPGVSGLMDEPKRQGWILWLEEET